MTNQKQKRLKLKKSEGENTAKIDVNLNDNLDLTVPKIEIETEIVLGQEPYHPPKEFLFPKKEITKRENMVGNSLLTLGLGVSFIIECLIMITLCLPWPRSPWAGQT